ncbi:hypothetical protein LP316_15810 [Thalassotalea sp. LPB0316]|uniref:hypothetical protein n=1 Tax=Thalassotalea sp. LPB0316 TaxID=2769490 RepID=UPI001868CD2F|nr:hypothetical protein [Thalassotalea sp. LPB0316]QOL25728.1 hypothetical protein LP316_15810 [Thalassotalea sp. LPB0316]
MNNKEIDKELLRLMLKAMPGLFFFGLGMNAVFPNTGKALHPVLDIPLVGNVLLAIGILWSLWGLASVIVYKIKNKHE